MLKNDGEKNEKNRVYVGERSGTAVPLQARAVPTYWFFGYLARHGMARLCHYRHGPCQASGTLGLKFFFFRVLESVSDNYLQNNFKQTKTDKKRLNTWVASHEALV